MRKNTKKKQKKSQTQNLKTVNILLAIVVILMLIITYLIISLSNLRQENKQSNQKIEKTISPETQEIRKDKFEEYTKEFYKEYTHSVEPKIEVKKEEIEEKPSSDDKNTNEKTKEEVKEDIKNPSATFEEKKVSNKPKLVVIIDDVTTKSQLEKLLRLDYKVTPSILPPTPSHEDSAKIARGFPFYMIHFPLEATSFNANEKHTLKVGDSYEKIEKRVAQLRAWYPNAIYTNNHTGSKFTSDEQSMRYLLKALKKHNFIFMDSRTTAKSVVKRIVGDYNMPYIVRNVFIDNERDFNYIQNQLKKAIKIAKQKGYAIAIGHPYKETFDVLRNSQELFKDLELIYLNELSHLN